MAKYKGKSQRRMKGWHQRVVAGGEADDTTDSRRLGFGRREVKLPPARLDAPEQNLDELPKTEGMVTGFYPGGILVRTADGPLLCMVAKTFRSLEGTSALTVGDNVTVAIVPRTAAEASTKADKDRADGMIIAREKRTSVLARPAPRSAKRNDPYAEEAFEKVLAANIDLLVLVVATKKPALRRGLVDRFLIIADRGGLAPVLVVNKIDLGQPDLEVLADLEHLELPMAFCSAESGEGLDDLREILTGNRSVLAGASGVGKTSLINAIIPGAQGLTREIRAKDNRGRHTTTAAVLYDLPGGGLIIDTPGIRELSLPLTAQDLPWYFPEFEQIAPQCKFNDCTHTHEPGCAVQKAVEEGQIPAGRYESYIRMLETIER
ncbi:MAG: ribosome small subunit-dependent GTPase A [Planctomycetaceae bacterium]|nr:ribosome small subunit-dependent GTPase A [Planctomycetaceae bacterium]